MSFVFFVFAVEQREGKLLQQLSYAGLLVVYLFILTLVSPLFKAVTFIMLCTAECIFLLKM